jgi:Lar family restriction alleviation protein
MSELKPCPFCGAEATRFTIGDDEPNNAGGDVIVCTGCQASSHVEFGRKENLVSCWNQRAESVNTDLLEALKALKRAHDTFDPDEWIDAEAAADAAISRAEKPHG